MKFFGLFLAVFLFLAGNGLAQNKPAPADRYYTGIGIQFERIINATKEFSCGQNLTCHNDRGEFTGSVVVTRVLVNGPAAKSGLQQGDLIEVVEGKNVVAMSSDEFPQAVKGGTEGRAVHLTVGKFETEELREEVGIEIVPAKIDRVGFVQLDQWMRNEIGGGTYKGVYELVFESKVTENKKDGTFHYQYRIRNSGKIGVLVRWGILERLVFGKFNAKWGDDYDTLLIALKPGQSKSFSLVSKDLSIYDYNGEMGNVSALAKVSDRFMRGPKTNGLVITSENMLTYVAGARSINAFIPETLVPEEK